MLVRSKPSKKDTPKKNMPRKKQTTKNPKPGTPEGYRAGLGGSKIRSRGRGRGLGIGRGKGPIGIMRTRRFKRYT